MDIVFNIRLQGRPPEITINYGFNPICNIDSPPVLLNDNTSVLTRDWVSQFNGLKKHLIKAKEDYKKFGDNRKSFNPKLKVNDKVWLKKTLLF